MIVYGIADLSTVRGVRLAVTEGPLYNIENSGDYGAIGEHLDVDVLRQAIAAACRAADDASGLEIEEKAHLALSIACTELAIAICQETAA